MTLEPFSLLADAARYVPCKWDMSTDEAGRSHLLAFCQRHIETILALGAEVRLSCGEAEATILQGAERCRTALHARLDRYRDHVDSYGRVTILEIARWRDACLREAGFADAFANLKARENAKMLPLLPTVIAQLDAIANDREQLQSVIEGVFAGNIFDMGAEATARAFVEQSPEFFTTRSTLPPRPWLIDDFDAFADRVLRTGGYRKAIFFIDNAGSDFLLGAVPMIRWLAQRGTRVVVAVNERPTLNDMTLEETLALWPLVVALVPDLANAPIEIVSTGTGDPLIDLSQISPALNLATTGCDLVILEGMGRGVESNLDARFKVDALNIAMIKDQIVASHVGGKVFDVVCQFHAVP